MTEMRCAGAIFAVLSWSLALQAQSSPVGSVAAGDARVIGTGPASAQPVNGRMLISGASTVTAIPGRNAELTLDRGGSVLVCQTTALHMTPSANRSLLLALDRGAMEIHTKSQAGDVIQTPDLRFSLANPGDLDLRIHVTFNGDTCVENRGHKAPALSVTDSFTSAEYLVKPGQHVMFERGSLRAVEDRETTPCGCPPDSRAPLSADAHPFPEAVSAGLAEPAPGSPEVTGVRHVEVDSTLKFDPSDAAANSAQAATQTAPPVSETAPRKSGFFASIGHFFKHLFVR